METFLISGNYEIYPPPRDAAFEEAWKETA